jgi:subtilase family serine protease
MIFLGVFLVLCVVQGGYIWFQWDKLSNIIELFKLSEKFVNEDDELKNNKHIKKAITFKDKVVHFVLKYKNLIWIPITLLLIVNTIIASIITILVKLALIIF